MVSLYIRLHNEKEYHRTRNLTFSPSHSTSFSHKKKENIETNIIPHNTKISIYFALSYVIRFYSKQHFLISLILTQPRKLLLPHQHHIYNR